MKNNGRSNAGRKPIDPKIKKVQILCYPEQQEVDGVGGKEAASEIALKAIKRTFKSKK